MGGGSHTVWCSEKEKIYTPNFRQNKVSILLICIGKDLTPCLPASLQDFQEMVIYSHLYLLFLLIMTSRYALQRVSAICYTPGGQERTSPPSRGIYEYQPCSKSDKFSMCCALNRTSGKLPGPDRCRDDGLCENPIGFAQLWRQSCTDPSWLSPSCIKICLHGRSKGVSPTTTYQI